ncbi:MAG: winged helix-turn-helix domain-containing protein [Planctomycetota bacterium]
MAPKNVKKKSLPPGTSPGALSASPPAAAQDAHDAAPSAWTFLSNHSHVLLLLAAEPDLRVRDLAERVAITERAVQKIIADLETAGILTRTREGRRNHYHVHADRPLRHPVESHRTVADLIAMVHGD